MQTFAVHSQRIILAPNVFPEYIFMVPGLILAWTIHFCLQTLKIAQVLIKKDKQAVTENNKDKEMWKHFYIASSFPGTISSYEEGY